MEVRAGLKQASSRLVFFITEVSPEGSHSLSVYTNTKLSFGLNFYVNLDITSVKTMWEPRYHSG